MSGSSTSITPPPLPLKVRFLFAAFTFFTDNACRRDMTLNRTLTSIPDPKAPASAKPIKGVSSFDITIHPERKLWFRLYTPNSKSIHGNSNMPVIVFFHGGGFCLMAANSKYYDLLCRRLAREIHAVVISVNYRLAPEYKYPCQYEDGFEAMKFIDSMNLQDLAVKVDLEKCFLAGDSAGGNLAHHVLMKASEYNFSKIKVIGFIAIQPFFGGEERTESEIKLVNVPLINLKRTDFAWKVFLPEGSNRNHEAANVYGPHGVDISGVKFPATIVFIGGFDILQDWQKRYCEGLKKSGKEVHLVEYPNAIHGFYMMPELPETSLLIREVQNFIKKKMAPMNS